NDPPSPPSAPAARASRARTAPGRRRAAGSSNRPQPASETCARSKRSRGRVSPRREAGPCFAGWIQLDDPFASEAQNLLKHLVDPVLSDRLVEGQPGAVGGVAQAVQDAAAEPTGRRTKWLARNAIWTRGGRPAAGEIPAVPGQRAGVAPRVALAAERRADVHQRVRPGGRACLGNERISQGLERARRQHRVA